MYGQQPGVGNNKQVCNFYQKGNCKYGTRCWNYHPPNQGGTTNTFLGGGSQVFGGKSSTPQDSKKEFQDFVKQVSGEMMQWERSGQWLVSSFSPLKGHPPFSGFYDTSPEEFRIKAYEALKSNTSSAYQAHWNEMQQRFKQLREAIRMSTQEAVQAMRDVFFTKSTTETHPDQQQTLKPPNLFGKPALLNTPNIFGGSTTQPNSGAGLLGAKPQSSVFGGPSSVFGASQPTSSIFGGNANKPVFGGQAVLGGQNIGPFPNQSTNVFGGSSSVFKGGTQGVQTSTLFGGNQSQTTTGPVFGSSASTASVQGQTSGNIFGDQNKGTGGSSIFGNNSQNQTSVFGGSGMPVAGSTMGAQGNIFVTQQQPQQQTGLFGNQPAQQQQQQSGSVFGSSNVFGNTQNPAPPQATPQPSVFGGAGTTGTSSASVFGGTPAKGGNIFGGSGGFGTNTQTGGGLFGNTPPNNVFANAAVSASSNAGTPGLFGKPAESTQPSITQGGISVFGEASQGSHASEASGVVAKEHLEWYTPMDQLKPEDKAQFEAEEFTSIPLCPPPIELCA